VPGSTAVQVNRFGNEAQRSYGGGPRHKAGVTNVR
jgi:hypothetical protein